MVPAHFTIKAGSTSHHGPHSRSDKDNFLAFRYKLQFTRRPQKLIIRAVEVLARY
jgi:hypothetical protein